MQLSWHLKCAGALLIATVYCCSASSVSSSIRRAPVNPIDVSVPLGKIGARLDTLMTRGLNLTLLVETLRIVLEDCLPSNETSEKFASVEIPDDLKTKAASYLLDYTTMLPVEIISAYCKSPDFKEIHNFLWVDGPQFNDVIKFLALHGMSSVYISAKAVYAYYDCPQELIDSIPSGPPDQTRSSNKQSSNIRDQVISGAEKELQLPFAGECNILAILMNLLKSGIIELLQLLESLIAQITQNPSMHFLIGKIQEPIKGPGFREFRLLAPVRRLWVVIHKAIISEPVISWILDLVETVTGLNLKEGNLIDTVLNIVEALLWHRYDPVPPSTGAIQYAHEKSVAFSNYAK